MKNSLFRKKNMDRLSSAEQLNDYIKVANPSVWILLAAILVLLLGLAAWLVFGQTEIDLVESVENTAVVVEVDA